MTPPTPSTTTSSVAVGYARLLDHGPGLEGQRRAIRLEAKRRGFSLAWSFDTSDQRETVERSGIARSLRLLEGDRHTALIVADLTFLTQSLSLLSSLFRRSADRGWAIISPGPMPVDTKLGEGRVLQAVLSTYDSLRDQVVEEPAADAVEPGRFLGPDQPSPRDRIVWERIAGGSLGQIANGLNRDGVPAPDNWESWLPSTVWAELEAFRPCIS